MNPDQDEQKQGGRSGAFVAGILINIGGTALLAFLDFYYGMEGFHRPVADQVRRIEFVAWIWNPPGVAVVRYLGVEQLGLAVLVSLVWAVVFGALYGAISHRYHDWRPN